MIRSPLVSLPFSTSSRLDLSSTRCTSRKLWITEPSTPQLSLTSDWKMSLKPSPAQLKTSLPFPSDLVTLPLHLQATPFLMHSRTSLLLHSHQVSASNRLRLLKQLPAPALPLHQPQLPPHLLRLRPRKRNPKKKKSMLIWAISSDTELTDGFVNRNLSVRL